MISFRQKELLASCVLFSTLSLTQTAEAKDVIPAKTKPAPGLSAGAGHKTLLDRLEASVNADTILKSDLTRFKRSVGLRAQIDPLFSGSLLAKKGSASSDKEIIEFLQNEKIITQAFPVGDTEVEQEIRSIQANNKMDRARLKTALTAQGFLFEDYFELIRVSISKKGLIDREIRSKVNISDDDVKNYFYNHYAKNTSAPRAYHIGMISLPISDYKSQNDAYDAATRARNALLAGEAFEEVAKRFNPDNSAGDLGVMTEDQMSEGIREQAKKLKIGEISPVFGGTSARRFMLVKLRDVKSSETDRLEKMKEEIRSQLGTVEYQHQISLWIERKKQASFIHSILTPGDPDGIGPEVTWKAIRSGIQKKTGSLIVCVGSPDPFKKMGIKPLLLKSGSFSRLALESTLKGSNTVALIPAPEKAPKGLHLQGYQSGWSIQAATQMVLAGVGDALVTGPISKERLNLGGFSFPGHTEFLGELCSQHAGRTTRPVMMLANSLLRITLVTTHLAVSNISKSLRSSEIEATLVQTAESLRRFWGIKCPRIAVAALNPHAGEAGKFGNEEIKIIEPAIARTRKKLGSSANIVGPLPADTLFAKHFLAPKKEKYDGVVCMYHDQGLIPVKLLDFYNTVNITLGLPIIRTSVDHGVGFDLVGKNLANPSSLCAAIEMAAQMVKRKKL
ncbi:MAG: 4-hydroxythreonine-4-phosphate dehydrogenase PdxA [Bdellovibrio sp.]|nr:4-hydroxythreonine-4-phosphate dehydrogenase PdxA [Bdellovibrio sp.]